MRGEGSDAETQTGKHASILGCGSRSCSLLDTSSHGPVLGSYHAIADGHCIRISFIFVSNTYQHTLTPLSVRDAGHSSSNQHQSTKAAVQRSWERRSEAVRINTQYSKADGRGNSHVFGGKEAEQTGISPDIGGMWYNLLYLHATTLDRISN